MVKYCTVKGCMNKHKKMLSGLCDKHQKEYNEGKKLIVEVLVDKEGKRICTYE